MFLEDMFKHSPSVILRDDMLEVFVEEGCGRTKDGIGNGLGCKFDRICNGRFILQKGP